MIQFKSNVRKILPYQRSQYIKRYKWYGVSFQLGNGKDVDIDEFIKHYEPLVKHLISNLDNGSYWIINHDDKDMPWWPSAVDNLPALRTLFRQGNKPNRFKGALLLLKSDLLDYSQELISYPYTVMNEDGQL